MFHQIRLSLREGLFRDLILSGIIFISLIFACIYALKSSAIHFPIEGWIEGCSWVDFFIPMLIPIFFSVPFYFKRKNDFVDYASIRIDRKTYILANISASVIATTIIVFTTYFLCLLLTIFVLYKASNPFFSESTYILNYPLGNAEAFHPIAFGLIWCLWKGFVSSLFTLFGMMMSLYVNNVFFISIMPFIYCMTENLVTALLGLERFSIFTSFVLNRLSPEASGMIDFITGVITFICITSLLVLLIKIRQEKLYENI